MYEGEPLYDDEVLKLVESLQQEVQYLRGRVSALESNQQMNQLEGLPNTWLLSHSLLKRAFAVYGHYVLAGLIIAVPFVCFYIMLMLAFGVSMGGFQ